MTPSEIAIGIILFLAIVSAYPNIMRWYHSSEDVSEFFVVNQFSVNDVIFEGEQVAVIYDRKILKPFSAQWTVEVQSIETNGRIAVICSGSGAASYSPSEVLPTASQRIGVTLSWLIGHENCKMPVGRYRIFVLWNMDRGDHYPPVQYSRLSNVFVVMSAQSAAAFYQAL